MHDPISGTVYIGRDLAFVSLREHPVKNVAISLKSHGFRVHAHLHDLKLLYCTKIQVTRKIVQCK